MQKKVCLFLPPSLSCSRERERRRRGERERLGNQATVHPTHSLQRRREDREKGKVCVCKGEPSPLKASKSPARTTTHHYPPTQALGLPTGICKVAASLSCKHPKSQKWGGGKVGVWAKGWGCVCRDKAHKMERQRKVFVERKQDKKLQSIYIRYRRRELE